MGKELKSLLPYDLVQVRYQVPMRQPSEKTNSVLGLHSAEGLKMLCNILVEIPIKTKLVIFRIK